MTERRVECAHILFSENGRLAGHQAVGRSTTVRYMLGCAVYGRSIIYNFPFILKASIAYCYVTVGFLLLLQGIALPPPANQSLT